MLTAARRVGVNFISLLQDDRTRTSLSIRPWRSPAKLVFSAAACLSYLFLNPHRALRNRPLLDRPASFCHVGGMFACSRSRAAATQRSGFSMHSRLCQVPRGATRHHCDGRCASHGPGRSGDAHGASKSSQRATAIARRHGARQLASAAANFCQAGDFFAEKPRSAALKHRAS
jgi:hypothetical protein